MKSFLVLIFSITLLSLLGTACSSGPMSGNMVNGGGVANRPSNTAVVVNSNGGIATKGANAGAVNTVTGNTAVVNSSGGNKMTANASAAPPPPPPPPPAPKKSGSDPQSLPKAPGNKQVFNDGPPPLPPPPMATPTPKRKE